METPNPTILVVDDNSDNLITIQAVLKDVLPEATLYTSLTGIHALELARSKEPDVILLDIVMPEMDGFEVCRTLKSDKRLEHIPVIFLTALKTDRDIRIAALDAGAEGFLSKPIDDTDLLVQIRAMLKIKSANDLERREKLSLEAERERLAELVEMRTSELVKELNEHRITEELLRASNKDLEDNRIATLNLLEDLRGEVEARRHSELSLRQSETNLNMAQRVANVGSWIWHIQTNRLEWSDQMYAIFEIDKLSFTGDLNDIIARAIHPDDLDRVIQSNLAVSKHKAPVPLEYRIVRANGTVRTVWAEAGELLLDDTGKPVRLSGIVQDISEQKQAHETIRESGERWRTIFKTSPDGIIITSVDGTIEEVSNVAMSMYGYDHSGEVLGRNMLEFVHESYHTKATAAVSNILVGNFTANSDYMVIKKDGSSLFVEINAAVLRDHEGIPTRILFIERDVTQRKLVEDELKRSYDLLHKLAAQVPGVVYQYRLYPDGRSAYPFSSPGMNDIYEYTPEEVKDDATPVYGRIHPDDYNNIVESVLESARTQQLYHSEFRVILPRQGLRWRLCDAQPERLDDGSTLWHGIITDITDRKRAETALRESEDLYRSLFDAHSAVKLLVDPETGAIIDANKAASRFYGWSVEQLKGMRMQEINTIPADELLEEMAKTVKAKQNYYEFRHQLADGSVRNVEVFAGTIIIRGKPFIHTIIHDITQKKAAERQIKLLGRSIEQTPVSIVITNPEGEIEYVNPEFTRMTEYEAEEVIGQNPRFLSSGEHGREFYEILWNTVLSGKDWIGEFQNKRRNGELYWERAVISPVMDESGAITHFIGIKEDITHRKQLLQELVTAKERAEESDRLKSTFLANMSHEVRTPMNAIIGFSDLLNDASLTQDDRTQYTQIIQQRSYDLLDIINDILDISMIDAGEIKAFQESGNVEEILQDLLVTFSHLHHCDGKAQVVLDCRNELRGDENIIITDVGRLRQVLTNLLSNAFKFTHEGRITFGCRVHNEKELHFFVEDTGIGISPEVQEFIFNRFRQADESSTRPYGGTGLGLSISRGIVELLGGKIWVDSTPGKGSTFRFTVPRKAILG